MGVLVWCVGGEVLVVIGGSEFPRKVVEIGLWRGDGLEVVG